MRSVKQFGTLRSPSGFGLLLRRSAAKLRRFYRPAAGQVGFGQHLSMIETRAMNTKRKKTRIEMVSRPGKSKGDSLTALSQQVTSQSDLKKRRRVLYIKCHLNVQILREGPDFGVHDLTEDIVQLVMWDGTETMPFGKHKLQGLCTSLTKRFQARYRLCQHVPSIALRPSLLPCYATDKLSSKIHPSSHPSSTAQPHPQSPPPPASTTSPHD